MAKKINFSEIKDTDRMVMFKDIEDVPENFRGKRLPILDDVFHLRYDDAIDFENGQVVYSHENDTNLPTLNNLVAKGWLTADWTPFKEIRLVVSDWDNINDFGEFAGDSRGKRLSVGKVVNWFAERGFKVSAKAILHNYDAWLGDLKSGYRDEENGVHVFTPCGCNPLSFSISELHPTAEDWQITYEC